MSRGCPVDVLARSARNGGGPRRSGNCVQPNDDLGLGEGAKSARRRTTKRNKSQQNATKHKKKQGGAGLWGLERPGPRGEEPMTIRNADECRQESRSMPMKADEAH